MKSDRKIKTEKTPPKLKTGKGVRQVTPKTNRKDPLTSYEHIPIGIVECSLDGRYMDVNEEFCRITGYTRSALLRRGIKDLTHEDDYALDIRLHNELVAGKIPFYRLEKRFVRKDGSSIWVELTRSLICDTDGEPLYTIGVALDISERKQVERVLHESVERLRLATGAAHMFMWEWDFQDQSYAIADNFEKVLGFSAGLLPKNSFETVWALSPKEDIQHIAEEFEKAVENGRDLHALSCRVTNPESGQIVWLEISAKIVYDPQGNPERMFGVAQNVTENKRVQDEIAIISRMPEENPNPVMRVRPDGTVLYANNPGMVILKSWNLQEYQIVPDSFQQHLAEVFASGLKREVEVQQDGNTFSCTLAPIREAGYVNVYGSNITARKQAEQKLRESEERFRALVSQATAGITESDTDGHLQFVNPRFCEMLGYSEEELLGKAIWELTYAADLEENKRLFERMLTQGESYQFEKRFIRKDSSTLWTSISVSTIRDLAGHPKGGVGVILDIEKRKESESALAEYARQQAALYKLSDQLHITASLEEVFHAALDAILSALQCDRASILLYDDQSVMRFVAWRGLSDAYRKAIDGHSPWTPDAIDPQPINVDDVRTAELDEHLRTVIEEEGIRSLAFIPLVSNGRLIGKFMVYFNAPHVFDDHDVDLSLTIAHQLAAGVDRQRAEEKLRVSEEHFRNLANVMPSIVWTAAPDGTITYANDQWFRFVGITPEENAKGWPELVLHPDDYERCVREWTRALETVPDEYRIEVRNRRYDGQYRWFQTRAIPVRDDSGKAKAWYGVATDIHERKEAEDRLTLLGQISEMLRNVDDPSDLMYRISEAVGERLHLKRALFNEIDLEHDREIVHRDYHKDLESAEGVHKITDYSSLTSAEVAAGRTVVNTDSKTDPRTAQDYERTYAQTGERAYVVVPLMRNNRWVASLWVSDDSPRQWSNEEISLLETVAERTWAIIEKLRIAQELRAKEAELEAMITQTPFMLTRCTRDLRYRFVSRAYAEMIGRTPEEVAGKPIVEIMGEEGLRTITPYIEQVLTGSQVEYESEVSFEGIGTPFLHVVYTPDRDEAGDVVGWFASIVDITERKQMEQALASERELLNRIFQSIPVMLTIYDPETRLLRLNRQFEQLIGWSSEEAAGISLMEAVYPDPAYREKVRQFMERCAENEWMDIQMRTRQGRTLETTWSNIRLSNDVRVGIGIDITESKGMEDALRIENERFMRFVNSNIVGILIGNAKGEVVLANDYYLRLLGVNRQDLVDGKVDWKQFTPAEWLSADEKAIRELRERGVCEPYEKEYVRANGTRVPVYIADAMLPGPGDEIAAFVLDITERKRAEEALRRNEQMFSTLVNAAPFGVYFIDSRFRLRSINRGAEAVFSNIDPLIGRDFAEILRILWKEPFATEAIERFRHTLRTGESFISPTIIEERANIETIQAYDWQIHRITLADGTFGVVCYFYDLSEQKRMEATVRASEALYRTIARSIPGGGVYVVDKDFRYLVAEGPVTGAFGLSREMLEGHTVTEAFPGERGEQMEDRLRRTFAGETLDFETVHNGRVYWTQQAPLTDSIGQAIILTLDITERKRAEEALRQSEERFVRFMQRLPGLAWIKDMEGRYVYANSAAEKAFGTPPEKLYGRTDQELFPADVAAQFRRNDELALTDSKGVQVVETMEQEDGILHHSLVSKFPIPGPDGTPALIGGTAFDITERLRAEEALRESEERLSAILRQATAGIVRKDAEGRLIFVNQAFCNMLGYTELELLGKMAWDFMHPDDLEENKRLYGRLMMEGIPFNLERRFLREDGSVIWVDASVSPIMDTTGRPQSAVTVEVDITARKKAEEALQQLNLQLEDTVLRRTAKLRAVNQTLREEIAERKRVEEALRQSEATARASEEKLRTLFDLLPVGISFLSPEGQIIQMNSALSVILQLPREQLLTQSYRSRKYIRANGTPMPPTEFASARALAQGTTVYNVETGIVLENGEVIWTSVSAAPVDIEDVGAVVVTVDITDSKRAEQALQESYKRLRILSQRLVEVQEDERRALARELHDRVGQTLAALNINLIIINGQLSPEVSEQIGTRLNDSMKLVAETISLVRDVMTDLRPSVLDDYGLEAAIESHLAQFTSRYNIKVKFEKPDPPLPRLGPSLEMTLLRITQEALMNIARHAQADQVSLSLREVGDKVCLTIQDNGIGIASRQDAYRPGSHGLNIMRERAEAFDGDFQVRSMPGRGTTVEVNIPFKNRSQVEEKDL